jgi:hypothetical protein
MFVDHMRGALAVFDIGDVCDRRRTGEVRSVAPCILAPGIASAFQNPSLAME